MNRFAQPLYGKIIYVFETNLTMEQLPTIFDPSTYWIDVTGIDCEVGYLVNFKDGIGLVLTPPPNLEYTFEELKAQKLELVDAWTEAQITGGFVSSCTGAPVRYDSDKDTQLTMQGIALNVDTALFAEKYPNGCPVRGYDKDSDVKTIHYLNGKQVMQWMADLSMHIGACKQEGWKLQDKVIKAKTADELEKIVVSR